MAAQFRDYYETLGIAKGASADEIKSSFRKLARMHHPDLATNIRVLAASLAVLGQLDEAQQAAEQMLAIDPAFRIGAWRTRSLFPEKSRDIFAQRLRLAGLPG